MDAMREPCPSRIVTDCGSAFAMGAIGGSLWHGVIMGWRQVPRGMRLSSAITAVKSRAPSLGGSFAVWGGLYSGFDCAFAYARGKEDFKNSIMSGASTGAVLAARTGWKGSLRSGIVGGALLALIEGVVFVMSRQAPGPQVPGYLPPPLPEEEMIEVQEKGGLLSGLFSGFSKETKTNVLVDSEEEALRDFNLLQEKEVDDIENLFEQPLAAAAAAAATTTANWDESNVWTHHEEKEEDF